jgi:PAS domain S-box-containing protein
MLADTNQTYFQSIVEHLPEYVFWKNEQLLYQGCNKRVAEYLSLSTPEKIVGKSDYDFGWNVERIARLHEVDKKILALGLSITVEDIIPKSDGTERIMLTSKSPLYDVERKIIGILGVSADITELKKSEEILNRANDKTKSDERPFRLQDVLKSIKAKKYFLTGEYEDIYLTKRQAECAYCLANGKTVKETGKLLGLSYRTIEFYLENVKVKLGVNTRSELISKLIEGRFLEAIKKTL